MIVFWSYGTRGRCLYEWRTNVAAATSGGGGTTPVISFRQFISDMAAFGMR